MSSHLALARLHYEIIQGLIRDGACPTNLELADRFRATPADVDHLLGALAEMHGVVLHPQRASPWVVHPFSLTPTLNWIEGRSRSWWAPCIWCAFGVATLVGGDVRLHSRYGAESDPIIIPVRDGQPAGFQHILVHFAIRPARAWDNVHEHCSLVLPFRNADEIARWCSRHALPRGESVPLHQVAALANRWYGTHANYDWHKWSVAEAQEIFRNAGLTSAFWNLENQDGRF
ncbi:MAG TPA: organomercurial lyase [Acidobacteriaceae bacterium]|nr:organomercurial lyase [Acidobacteriaceae bacterium]